MEEYRNMWRRHSDTHTSRVAGDRPVAREENTAYPDTIHATPAPAAYGRTYDAFSWVSLLGGLWIAISPWVLAFNGVVPRLEINNLIIGLAAAFIAMGSMTALRGVTGSGAANAVLGAWIIATAFFLFPASAAIGIWISQIVGGAVILAFALAGQFGARMGPRASHT